MRLVRTCAIAFESPTILNAAPLSWNESNPNITYVGNWVEESHPAYIDGVGRYCTEHNASAEVIVPQGYTRCKFHGIKGNRNHYGNFEYYVNNISQGTGSWYINGSGGGETVIEDWFIVPVVAGDVVKMVFMSGGVGFMDNVSFFN